MTVQDSWTDPTGATLDLATGDVVTEAIWDAIPSDLLYLFKRRVVELTNRSGGQVVAGDVVVLDTSNDASFTTTTAAQSDLALGVAAETIANAASGKVVIHGLASVNVNGTTARGNWIATSTTVKQGAPSSTDSAGAFARATAARTGAGLVQCLVFGLQRERGTLAAGTETITGAWTFDTGPLLNETAPTTPTANKVYEESIAKGWVKFQADGTIAADLNVSSITDNGTGDFTVNWATAFASAEYAVAIAAEYVGGDLELGVVANGGQAAGTLRVEFRIAASTLQDPNRAHVIAFGAQ